MKRPTHHQIIARYGLEWPEVSRRAKERASYRCEACGAPHGPTPHVLTVDHLDYNTRNHAPSNLIALCQRCHLRRQQYRPRIHTRTEAIAILGHGAHPAQLPLFPW